MRSKKVIALLVKQNQMLSDMVKDLHNRLMAKNLNEYSLNNHTEQRFTIENNTPMPDDLSLVGSVLEEISETTKT